MVLYEMYTNREMSEILIYQYHTQGLDRGFTRGLARGFTQGLARGFTQGFTQDPMGKVLEWFSNHIKIFCV